MSGRGATSRTATRLARLAAAVALCATLAPPSAALGVDLDTYRDDVAQARAMVDAAANKPLTEREATDLALEVNALVPLRVEVETPDGVAKPDNTIVRTLVAQLDAADTISEREEYVADLAAHLAAMESALGAPGAESRNVVPEDPAALQALLDTGTPARSPVQEWLAGLIDRLAGWLSRWFSNMSGSSSAGIVFQVVFYVVVGVLALVLLYTAYQFARRWRAGIANRTGEAVAVGSTDAVIEAARDLPADALSYADECAAGGDRREAVRALFGGAARALQESGYIVEARTRTNHELLVEVRPRSPEIYAPLRELALVFERSWYGHRDPAQDEYAAARERYVTVTAAARAAIEAGEAT